MRKILVFILFLVISRANVAHPLHVSILNITFSNDRMEISINTFVDDWETAYFHYFGKPLSLKLKENYEGDWLREYLEKSIRFYVDDNDEELKLELDSISFNELSMKLELHTEISNKPKSLYIYNALLTDIFADQTNLLILSFNEEEKGIKFDYKKRTETIKLR